MKLPISVWTLGDPVAGAVEVGGSFFDMIRRGLPPSLPVQDFRGDRYPCAYPQPGEVAGIVLSGSIAYVTEELPWMRAAAESLRLHLAAGTPILGICFGHQLLGLATGGQVANNPAGREIGSVQLSCFDRSSFKPSCVDCGSLGPGASRSSADSSATEQLQWGLLKEELGISPQDLEGAWVQATHLQSVLTLGAGVQCFARTTLEPHAFLRFAPGAYGVQFHPEMNQAILAAFIEERRPVLSEEGLAPAALLDALKPSSLGPRILDGFGQYIARLQGLRA